MKYIKRSLFIFISLPLILLCFLIGAIILVLSLVLAPFEYIMKGYVELPDKMIDRYFYLIEYTVNLPRFEKKNKNESSNI